MFEFGFASKSALFSWPGLLVEWSFSAFSVSARCCPSAGTPVSAAAVNATDPTPSNLRLDNASTVEQISFIRSSTAVLLRGFFAGSLRSGDFSRPSDYCIGEVLRRRTQASYRLSLRKMCVQEPDEKRPTDDPKNNQRPGNDVKPARSYNRLEHV